MKEVFVVEAIRTPFGSFGGALADVSAPQLAAGLMSELVRRHGLPGEAVDEVIVGQVLQGGSGQAPARMAMRQAGLPDSVHAMTVNKVCGSGLKSIMLGADAIRLGEAELVIAGGMESMSLAPYALPKARFGQRMGDGTLIDLMIHDGLRDPYSGRHMGEITETWVQRHGVSREEQDRFAVRSYTRSQAAVNEGVFADELLPVTIKTRKGEVVVEKDEEPFKGNPEKLSSLRPVFDREGTITAGNASTLNDGAALALLAGEEALERHKLTPAARLVASSTNSIAPDLFAEAPVEAIRTVAAKGGVDLDRIGLFEINEAFAAVPLVAIAQLGIDEERVNVNGGAVSLGHPIGASGGRLAATLVREMKKRRVRYGVAALCIGGGEAVAALFELV